MAGGMVAIVQGLTDAGLAVTLMNSQHLQKSLQSSPVSIKSSVETCTNTERVDRRHMLDDHYTSTYQMAHCQRSTSPPEQLLEFPSQRSESARRAMSSRIYPPDVSTDLFVHSLRRYEAPEKTVSSELVQRLLDYTQKKHLSRVSTSGRSLRDERPTKDKWIDTSSKNIQTYTRTRRHNSKDCSANTHNDIRFGFGKERKMASESPYFVRAKHESNDGYDYLSSTRRSHRHEVRYLNDVKKCIRDTIKQIYDDKPTVCPQIKRRYSQHKKEHHQNSADTVAKLTDEGSRESAESSFGRCRPPTEISTCPNQLCCKCEAAVCACFPDPHESTPTSDINTREQAEDTNKSTPASDIDTKVKTEATNKSTPASDIDTKVKTEATNKSTPASDIDTKVKKEATKKSTPASDIGTTEQAEVTKKSTPTSDIDAKVQAKVDKCVDCTCKDKRRSIDKTTVHEIFQWMKTLPVFADDSTENKEKRAELVQDLADKLNGLDKDEEFEVNAKNEIKKCLEKLPMWYPGAKRDQEIFKNQISDDLYRRVIAVDSIDDLKEAITQWVGEIQFEKEAKVDEENIVEILTDRLKRLGKNSDEMKSQIKDLLEDLPIVNKRKVIDKLADKLTDVLEKDKIKRISTSLTDEKLEQEIVEWLNDVLELSEDIKVNQTMITDLGRSIKKIQAKGLAYENTEEEIKEAIIHWIERSLDNRGEKLDSKTKNKISNKLIDKLARAVKIDSKLGQSKSSGIDRTNYEPEIWKWWNDIVDILQEDKRKQQKTVQNLANKLQELKTENVDDSVIEEEIVDFLNSLSIKGLRVKNKEKLVKKLIDMISKTERRMSLSQDEQLQQSVFSEIFDLVEDIPSNINKDKRKDIKDKVTDILAKNINSLSSKSNNITQEIVNILKKEAKMPGHEAADLASAIVNRVKGMPYLDISTSSDSGLQNNTDMKLIVSDEVSDILNDFNIGGRNKKDLEKSITEVLANQIMRGIDNSKTKDDLVSILQGANLSEDDALNISNRLLERNNELSLSYKTKDSKLGISNSRISGSQFKSMSPEVRNEFEDKAEEVILDFIEDVSGNDRKQRKDEVGNLVHKLGDIISNLDNTDKDKSIFKEISQYLENAFNVDMSRDEMAKELFNRLQNISIQASTPKKSTFYPKRETIDISSIHIDDEEFTNNNNKSTQEEEKNEEKNFLHDLTNLIHMWIDELPINLRVLKDKDFKVTIAEDLASDIVDRQKYMQINPEAKTSYQEELEHLKYQLFRWLNKLIDIHDLSLIMQKTDALMTKIKDLNVPKLICTDAGTELKKKNHTEPSVMLEQDSSQFIEENLVGGIKEWVKAVPLFKKKTKTDMQEIETMIQELANGLKNVFTNTQDSYDNVDTIYIDEIRKHFEVYLDTKYTSDSDYVRQVAEQLLSYLKDLQIFANISNRQEIPVNKYLKHNLDKWINSLPIARVNSTQKILFENLKKDFVEKLEKLREKDALNEQKIKNEIKSYLYKFPIKEKVKQDTGYINDKVEELFKNLLAVPVERNLEHISSTFVNKAVFDWLKLLPIDKRKTVQDIDSNAINDLISAISNLIVKTDVIRIREIKKTVEDATENFLRSVPLDSNININVQNLADELFNIVKTMSRNDSYATKTPTLKKAADVLIDDIGNWVDNLPLKEATSEEAQEAKKVKQDIASKLIHKIGELNMNPQVFQDDFLYEDLLEDEIDNLLTVLSSEDVQNNLRNIKRALLEKVKEARQKTREEVAGQAYKQQLREAISKTLPSEPLTAEEEATFEVLKDNLADAFITLHYVGNDEELKTKYKRKINEEVSKFSNDYLKNHPGSPIDRKKLNQDLYNALKAVPIPKEETVRSEVELVKIKDEVNNWIKELPLTEQTTAQKVQTTKMIAVLAKKLHDIEKQDLSPEEHKDTTIKEITKWLKKLPLEIDDEKVRELTEKLVNQLKDTEESRRVSASTRHSIPDVFDLSDMPDTPKISKPNQTESKRSYTPPSTSLSIEDQLYLQKIRERSDTRARSLSKDASVNPLPIDAGSQTEMRPWEQTFVSRRQSFGLKRPEKMHAVGSQAEVAPHVIVKEYYWDATEAAKLGLCTTCPHSPNPSQTKSSPCQTPDNTCLPRFSPEPSRIDPMLSRQTCTECPKTPRQRRTWENFREDLEPGTSRSFGLPRVTRLGSFDEPMQKDWSKFSDEGSEDRKGEKRCRCREKILSCSGKKMGRRCRSCQPEDVKRCAKCCGVHCPYPSYLYFRK